MKSLLLALAVSLCATVVAHADDSGYRRPAPRQQQQQQIPEDYDQYEEQDQYQDQYQEQAGCEYQQDCEPRQQQYQQYECESYRGRRGYQAGCETRQEVCRHPCEPPRVLPMPGRHPGGPCTVVPSPTGLTIVVHGDVPVASLRRHEVRKLGLLKYVLAERGICTYYTN